MKARIHVKSAMVGAAVVGGLLLLAGASGVADRLPPLGRFQIACTSSICYLVDTATGQVWMSAQNDFAAPKLQGPPPGLAGQAQDFVGQWASDDPQEQDLRIRLEPDGTALATEGSKRYDGNWHAEGKRVVVTVEDETVVGELQPDGRLLLWEEGDQGNGIPFKRVP